MKTKLLSRLYRITALTTLVNPLLTLLLLLPVVFSSAQVRLVKDINTTPNSGSGSLVDYDYTQLTDVNGTLYFVLKFRELWKTESSGTTATFVKSFSHISRLMDVNGTLFFIANDGSSGLEVWKSDGTEAGTVRLKDIRPGAEGSTPEELTNVNGTLFFTANDGATGKELWKSDGTPSGTVRVKDILRVVGSSNPYELTAMNGVLYFTANDGQHGYELWRSDGTAAGTTIVKDIRPDYKVSGRPEQLTNVNGVLFFSALEVAGVRRLWKSDGTEAGTVLVSDDINDLQLLTNVNGTLFFAGRDAAHGRELWKSDGTAAGTMLVKDFTPGAGSVSGPGGVPHLSYFTSAYGKLYFLAVTQPSGTSSATAENFWVSDGTEAGTLKLTEYPGTSHRPNPWITPFDGLVYFISKTSQGYESLFRTDGTPEGEEIFVDNIAGPYFGAENLTVVGNYLYYGSHGDLWRTDGTDKEMIGGALNPTHGSNPTEITDANGIIYFQAPDPLPALWKSDGTEAGTSVVQHFEEGPFYFRVSGNYLYYLANAIDYETTQGMKLWSTNLTTGETTWVSDINSEDDYIADLEDVNGTLFFTIEVPVNPGQEFPRYAQLWKTTGTLASTQFVKTFNEAGLPPFDLTNVNGTLFFSAVTDPNVGEELWKSDGTPEGTVMVKKINPNPEEPSAPQFLTNVNGVLYFVAYSGDYELYKSDGTAAGTMLVKDIRPDDQGESDIRGLININGMLHFVATDEPDAFGNYPRHLWKTDGTEAGTVKMATFAPYSNSGYPAATNLYILGAIDESVIMSVLSPSVNFTLHHELWKTDGTEEGTEMLSEGDNFLSSFFDTVVKDDIIYYLNTASGTQKLWRTDGTACGTFEVIGDGNPGDLTLSNGKIYMVYTDPAYGREVFELVESEINVPSCEAMTASSVAREADPFNREADAEGEQIRNYPNPFTTDFVLNVAGKQGGSFYLAIRDVKGAATGEYRALAFNQDHHLGGTFPPGVYLLNIRKSDGIIVKKMIKTR